MGCSHLLLGRVGQSGAETGRSCDGSTLAAEAAGPCTKARRRIRALAGRQRVAAFPLLVGAQRAQRQRVVFLRVQLSPSVCHMHLCRWQSSPLFLWELQCVLSRASIFPRVFAVQCAVGLFLLAVVYNSPLLLRGEVRLPRVSHDSPRSYSRHTAHIYLGLDGLTQLAVK